jgi:hypothetical protein
MDADTTTIFHTTSISPEGDKITQLKCADKWLACVIENGATGDQVLKWYSVNRLSQEIQFQATHVISKK